MSRPRSSRRVLADGWSRWFAGVVLVSSLAARAGAAEPTGLADAAPAERSDEAASGPPSPSARDVVLLDPPERLETAMRAALAPWGRRVESVSHAKPAPTLPGSALQAASLARELGAQALVWLSSNRDGSALWIYELSKDTVTARPFPTKPMNHALAAALALSVKTWLRSTEPREAEPEPLVPDPAPSPSPSLAPPPAPAPRDTGVREARELGKADRARWQVLVLAAARRGAVQPAAFQPRFGVEVRAAPWQSAAGGTRLWVGMRGEAGDAHAIADEDFRGVYTDWAGGLSLGVSQALADVFGVAMHVGATVHRSRLSGTLLPEARGVAHAELGAAAHVRPEAEFVLGPIGLVLQPSLGYALGETRYTVGGSGVLETGRLWWTLGGAVRLDVF